MPSRARAVIGFSVVVVSAALAVAVAYVVSTRIDRSELPTPPRALAADRLSVEPAQPDDVPERAVNDAVDAVREAALRYLFEHNDSGIGSRAAAYCIKVRSADNRWRDPSQSFVRRFRLDAPRVVPSSHCHRVGDEGVFEITTGRQALEFAIYAVSYGSPSTATISAIYSEGPLSAAGYELSLELHDGRWVVEDAKTEWIS